jgi:hypothetical protein
MILDGRVRASWFDGVAVHRPDRVSGPAVSSVVVLISAVDIRPCCIQWA